MSRKMEERLNQMEVAIRALRQELLHSKHPPVSYSWFTDSRMETDRWNGWDGRGANGDRSLKIGDRVFVDLVNYRTRRLAVIVSHRHEQEPDALGRVYNGDLSVITKLAPR